jgi:hypothetical protein
MVAKPRTVWTEVPSAHLLIYALSVALVGPFAWRHVCCVCSTRSPSPALTPKPPCRRCSWGTSCGRWGGAPPILMSAAAAASLSARRRRGPHPRIPGFRSAKCACLLGLSTYNLGAKQLHNPACLPARCMRPALARLGAVGARRLLLPLLARMLLTC